MHKSFFFAAILILVANFSFAQNNSKLTAALDFQLAKKATSEDLTVWIFFTDKGDNLEQRLAVASQNIGERALARRKRSLKGKPLVTHYDIPVFPEYLEQVQPLLSKLRHQSKWLNAVSAQVNPSQLQEIAAFDFVKKIDVVRKGKRDEAEFCNNEITNVNTVTENSSAAFYNLNYGGSLTQLEQMNVPVVHDLGYTGAGMLICLMDSGFRNVETLPVFATMDVQATYDFVNDDENVDNEGDMGTGSHGTSTLSTIGGFAEGTLIGPAYGASYLLAKTENTDSETTVEEDNWVAAAEWAEGLGADITSTSLGYIGFDDGSGYTADSLDGNTATITIAGDILASMGVLVVNSAGNSGNGVTTIGAPADGFEVFAIGAVTANGTRSGFSSVGPTTDGRIKPDVMAMGSGVLAASWNGNYNNTNGTSFSCPLVAGAAALLWEMVPTATSTEIREALRMTADNASSPNNEYGWGIINLYAAFESLTMADTEAPVAQCQDVTLYVGIDGGSTLEASAMNNGSTDNIGVTSLSVENTLFTCTEVGETMVELTVGDPAGNTSTCTATVTVLDTIAPAPDVMNLPDLTAECALDDLPMVTSFDNCEVLIIGATNTTLPIENQGTTIITWTYEDPSGNTTTQTQNVIIDDLTPPVVLTQDITIDLNGASSIDILASEINNGSTDNCNISSTALDISTFTTIGEYTVTLSVTDENGNTSTGTATVTVIDSFVSSTNELENTSFNLYPNPAKEKITINFQNPNLKNIDLEIYNTTGQLVKQIKNYKSNTEIPVQNFTNGLYILKIKQDKNFTYKKIIITK